MADNVGIFQSTLKPYLSYVRSSPEYTSQHHPMPMEYNGDITDGVEVSIYRPLAAPHAA